jgi:plastocyanin
MHRFPRLLILALPALLLAACGGEVAAPDPADTPTETAAAATEEAEDTHDPGGMHDDDAMVHDEDEMSHRSEDHHGAGSVVEPVDGAPEAGISAIDLAFEPGDLELTAGEPVNVTVVNDGAIFHDWTLEEAGVHLNVDPGEEAASAVVIDEPGTYEARCTVAGHAEAGMVMDVVVR